MTTRMEDPVFNWSLVFTTSAGWVTADASIPAPMPQPNFSSSAWPLECVAATP